jgi:hypothetical protein
MTPSDGIWVHREGNSLKIHPSQVADYERRGWQRSDPSFARQASGAGASTKLAGQPPFPGAVRISKTGHDGGLLMAWTEASLVENMVNQGWSVVGDAEKPAAQKPESGSGAATSPETGSGAATSPESEPKQPGGVVGGQDGQGPEGQPNATTGDGGSDKPKTKPKG